MRSITLEDGKYTITQHDNGEMHARRHGERWRDLTGDKMIGAMFSRIEDLTDGKVCVDAAALRQILQALNGPGHYIAELQATRRLGDSPIDKLVEQFNAQVGSQT